MFLILSLVLIGLSLYLLLPRHIKLFNYTIEFGTARWPWSHFKIHKGRPTRHGEVYYYHIVWGKLSLVLGHPHLIPITVCSECMEQIEVKSAGDECWDYCEGCQQVEGNTEEITTEEYEAYHNAR